MHFRLQLAVAFTLSFSLLSCNDSSKADKEIIKAMEESLISSNKTVSSSSEMILASLEDKLSDPTTSTRALIWHPKAQKTKELSSEFINYVEQLKKEENIGREKASLLLKKMKECRDRMLDTDSLIRMTFDSPLYINSMVDSSSASEEAFFNRYFNGVSNESANAFLSKLQNNTIVFANKLLSFCHEQIPRWRDHFDYYSAIVGQSSEVVEPGKEINIKAGVGAFSKSGAKSQININGKNVPPNDYGVSEYYFKVPKVTGKYSIPVKISYTDQEGKEQIIETRVKYTVAKICEQ